MTHHPLATAPAPSANQAPSTARSVRFWWVFALLLLGAAAIYLVGDARVPLWDRDEPWYAQCSREMLQSGNWVVPTFLGQWRLEKPPLIYWLQATAMKVAGDTGQAARFPSAVAVVLTALLLGLTVRRFVGERLALWSAFIFCTAALPIAAAKFCLTDATLMFFVVLGQVCLACIYAASQRGESTPWWAAPLFWISVGLAGLTKGPQALGMHLVTLLVLLLLDATRDSSGIRSPDAWRRSIAWWRRLRSVIGVPLLIVIVAPWLIAIHNLAPGFIKALVQKAAMHAGTSMDGHGQLPGYQALLIFGTFFPWSLFLTTAVAIAWKNRRSPATRFAIACVAGPWLLMECVRTKVPFYCLAVFPSLSFLTADALLRCAGGQFPNLLRRSFLLTGAVWAVAALALSAAPWLALLAVNHHQLPVIGMAAFTAAGTIYAALVFLRLCQQKIIRAALVIGVGMGVLILILYSAILPHLGFLQLPERLARDLNALGAYGRDVPVAMIGYNEPSLPFYQGGGARERMPAYLQSTSPSQWPRWIVITDRCWNELPPRVRQNVHVRFIERGLNYSNHGDWETVLVLEKMVQTN